MIISASSVWSACNPTNIRSLHIAKPLREAGIPVIVGGFHVSGMLAMFPSVMADLQEALDMGVTLFAGEAEGRMDEVVRDAAAGKLKPLYNYIDDLPALEDAVTPFLPGNSVRKTIGNVTTFDAGRGCPFQCSFCTIINVQGANRAGAAPTTSSVSCARTTSTASTAFSSPTTISPATTTGN